MNNNLRILFGILGILGTPFSKLLFQQTPLLLFSPIVLYYFNIISGKWILTPQKCRNNAKLPPTPKNSDTLTELKMTDPLAEDYIVF